MQARYIQRGVSIDFVPERDIAAGEIVIRNGLVAWQEFLSEKRHSAVLLFPECST